MGRFFHPPGPSRFRLHSGLEHQLELPAKRKNISEKVEWNESPVFWVMLIAKLLAVLNSVSMSIYVLTLYFR